jgi:dUTP pyrophosphatase
MPIIKFQKLHPDALLPVRMTRESIGLDVSAFLLTETGRQNNLLIPPGNTRNVPTRLLIEPPRGYWVAVCSRSGLASKSVVVANAPGVIDPDYRGELRVLLYNGSNESVYVQHEQRIAQLVLLPAHLAAALSVTELSKTERGSGGFGSTGS